MKSGSTRIINGRMFFLSMENVFYLGSKLKRQESREHFGTNKVHCMSIVQSSVLWSDETPKN